MSEPQCDIDAKPSHLAADVPIKTHKEDALNRGKFAKTLAATIVSWKQKPSLVIALFGDWGSGKSSLKNLALEHMQQDQSQAPLILEFSPWQFSGLQSLHESFFRELATLISKSSLDPIEAKRRSWNIKRYLAVLKGASSAFKTASAFEAAHHNPTGALVASGAATVTAAITPLIEAAAGYQEAEDGFETLSIQELKDKVAKDLEDLDEPILVVIDDIDRLMKDEIRLLLQMVKANADFPNVIYLLLSQRDILEKALDDIAPDKGAEFLEKIIQVSFDVPQIDRSQINGILFRGLDRILDTPGAKRRFEKTYWYSVEPNFSPLFKNVRDINRYLGALDFHVSLLTNEDSLEVNPIDLIVIEAIRQFEPAVYRELAKSKNLMTSTRERFRDRNQDSDQNQIKALINLCSENNRGNIKDVLGTLFPQAAKSLDTFSAHATGEEDAFQDSRICSPRIFDRYFELALQNGEISQADVERVLDAFSEPTRLSVALNAYSGSPQLDDMLSTMQGFATRLPKENADHFLIALYSLEIEPKTYGFFDSPPERRIGAITYRYLMTFPEGDRKTILLSVITKARNVGTIAYFVSAFLGENERSNSPLVPNESERVELKNAAVKRAAFAASKASLDAYQLKYALDLWMVIQPAKAASWAQKFTSSERGIVRFLQSRILKHEIGSKMRRFLHVANIVPLISTRLLRRRLSQVLKTHPTEEAARLSVLLDKAINREKSGRGGTILIEDAEEDDE